MKFTASAVLACLASTGVALSARELPGPGKKPKGFVYTDGWKFMLDGKPFLYAGTNAYWLPFLEVSNPSVTSLRQKSQCFQNPDDLHPTFKSAKDAGLKVIRTWGFNDKNVTFVPGGLPQYVFLKFKMA